LKQIIPYIFTILISFSGFTQTQTSDSTLVENIFKECDSIEFKEPERALQLYKRAYNISIESNYYEGAFKATLYSGSIYNNLAKYDSALYYFDKAKPLSIKTGLKLNEALISLKKANTYMFQGDLDQSLENHYAGISYLEDVNDLKRLVAAYANASTVFGQLDDYDKQIEYLKKSLNVTPNDSWKDLSLTYGDIGLVYLNKAKLDNTYIDKAYFNFSKADSISKLTNSPMLNFFVPRNWGDYYGFTDDCKTAIDYFETALTKAREYKYKYYEKDLIINLGECHLKVGNLEEAQNYLEEALSIGKKIGTVELPKKALILLSELNEQKNNYKKANKYLKEHLILKDSLINEFHITAINELETKYQTEKKDKEIVEQQLNLEKSQAKTKTMTILIISLLLASILLWFMFQQRQKRIQQQLITIQKEQEVLTLESLIAGEEKERLRIAQELHDGVNGDLSAIKFKLTSLLKMNNEVINEAVKDFNLIEALDNYCENMNDAHKPDIQFQHIGSAVALNKKIEVNIFRIVQELVTNAVKHAEAKIITIQTSYQDETIQLTVEDDGNGFETDINQTNGIGLQNLKSRVDYLNADMDLLSN